MTVNYTPGVYVQEVSTLPPSVVQVATAVPAFFGYTEKGEKDIKRITSLLEFQQYFGGPAPVTFEAKTDANGKVTVERKKVDTARESDPKGVLPTYLLYYAVHHFFLNGGGACYIASVGTYDAAGAVAKQPFLDILTKLKREDEPTLIVLTDAISLGSNEYYDLCQQALKQCADLGDRFTILDVPMGASTPSADADSFRGKTEGGIGANNLMYGAAYYPYVETMLSYADVPEQVRVQYPNVTALGLGENTVYVLGNQEDAKVSVQSGGTDPVKVEVADKKLTITLKDETVTGKQVVEAWQKYVAPTAPHTPQPLTFVSGDVSSGEVSVDGKTITLKKTAKADTDFVKALNTALATAQATASDDGGGTDKSGGFNIVPAGDGSGTITLANLSAELQSNAGASLVPASLAALAKANANAYHKVAPEIAKQLINLPPSAAIAGVYATVDRTRGEWKAPANVGVNAVTKPLYRISDDEQDGLNVDADSGKSINAIRAFSGRGTLVWGARTLAGNSNEWRYVPVRRLFITIEESTRKASQFAVFEPNTATTWLKVKAMIDGYLYGLWQQGAFAGATPDDSYFVRVGLGQTMTEDDVLNGIMNVEIGVAAVRPAEFIVLKFSHKLIAAS